MLVEHRIGRVAVFLVSLWLASGAGANAAPPVTAPGAAIPAPPRPLLAEDRYAAQLVADYLARGPVAFHDALSSRSPLRALGPAEALREIEARTGTAKGERWELRTPPRSFPAGRVIFSVEYPSGLDQAVVLFLIPEGGGLRLSGIRSFTEVAHGARSEARPAAAPDADGHHRQLVNAGVAVAVGGLCLAAAVLLRRRVWMGLAVAALGVAGLGTGAVIFLRTTRALAPPVQQTSRRVERVERFERLAPLLSLRAALERGESPPVAASAPVTARLWAAQFALQRGDVAEAKRLLASVPSAEEVPWADVLRGRVAFVDKNEAESVRAYERVIEEGVFHDGLLVEAIEAFTILGYWSASEWGVEKLTDFGSRSADSYYTLAERFAAGKRWNDVDASFSTGWRLRPLQRRVLFSARSIWPVLRRPALYKLLALDAPRELPSDPGVKGSEPLRISQGAALHRCAASVRLELPGGGGLVVQSGSELAPPHLPAEDAEAETREEEQRSLAELGELRKRLSSVGAMSQPALRRQLETTCLRLANGHLWRELASLTAGFRGADEQVPTQVLLMRAEALRRTSRADLGRTLLLDLEKSPVLSRQKDPFLLYLLGQLLSVSGDLDGAIRSLEQAFLLRRDGFLHQRLQGLKAEKKLSASFTTTGRGRFEIHAPPNTAVEWRLEAARILNAEWTRMEHFIPSVAGRTIGVDLLLYSDFQRMFGSEVIGVYDGKIRLPLVSVAKFSPPIVELMSHELAHAMIADATEDRAPHWFHEGLAQRLEMRETRENKIADLKKRETLLALSALEMVLETFPDMELVESAYHQAEWILHFIEKRFGRPGIARLLSAFRAGKNTDKAVKEALGISVNELDQRFREWALQEAPREMKDLEVVKYD